MSPERLRALRLRKLDGTRLDQNKLQAGDRLMLVRAATPWHGESPLREVRVAAVSRGDDARIAAAGQRSAAMQQAKAAKVDP